MGRVCKQEGLPQVHGFEQLAAGEQRILQSLGVIDYVQQNGQDRRTPRVSGALAQNKGR